jgi:hypothetical protein
VPGVCNRPVRISGGRLWRCGSEPTKADFLADVANRTWHDLVIRCTKSDEFHDYFSVSMMAMARNR